MSARILIIVMLLASTLIFLDMPMERTNKEIQRELLGGIKAYSVDISCIWKSAKKQKKALLHIKTITGSQPPSSGDWIINQTTTVENEDIIVNGSIIITSTGKLILLNSTIRMNLSQPGQYGIEVQSGGNITLVDSQIRAYNANNPYYFKILLGSEIKSENSVVLDVGVNASDQYGGLYIETSKINIISIELGKTYMGIVLHGVGNVTLENISSHDAVGCGMKITLCENVTIKNANISYNPYVGICVDSSKIINIISGTFERNSDTAIYMYESAYCNISGNIIGYSDIGIELVSSNNNIISNNNFTRCGLYVYDSYNNIVQDNYVNGKQLVYLENAANQVIVSPGQLIAINSEAITIQNADLSHVTVGIELWATSNSLIENCTITYTSFHGIILKGSDNNRILNCDISYNTFFGITIEDSNNTIVENCDIVDNYDGIFINDHSFFNNISNNRIKLNYRAGVYVQGYSMNNTISSNNISQNNYGIYLNDRANYNNITFNTISYNHYGIYIGYHCEGNNIFGNNFIGNTYPIDTRTRKTYNSGSNKWNTKYVGNYWSDYTGSDTNNDGIGDTPYRINSNEYDERPLMEPIYPYEDKDGDGLTNIWETYRDLNPLNADTDNDNIDDGWEVLFNMDPLDDSDAYLDTDNDDLTNIMEYTYSTNPLDSDTDGDGMPDGWEVEHGLDPLYDDANLDVDGDSIANIDEYLLGIDPLDNDTDGDGMPDGWEVEYGLDPRDCLDKDYDVDGDGLSNYMEYVLGTDPRNVDSDNDGSYDGEEVLLNTDPLVSQSHPVPAERIILALVLVILLVGVSGIIIDIVRRVRLGLRTVFKFG